MSSGKQVFYILAYLLFAFTVTSVGVYIIWNWLVTDIFGLRVITYFEAFALNVLARLLFQTLEFTYEKEEE